ncbi:MAG: DUF4358 domain-containing protein, partial [Oscillospiraceae bacterium]
MKKIISVILVLVMSLGIFTACSKKAKEYTNDQLIAAIKASGNEMTEYNEPVAFDAEEAKVIYDFLEFDKENYKSAAFSISLINIKAYGIAVVQPAEGKAEAVIAELQGYVDTTKKNFEQYLQDQYAVAQNAIVKQLD